MAFTESIPVDLYNPRCQIFQKLATPNIYENQRDKWIK